MSTPDVTRNLPPILHSHNRPRRVHAMPPFNRHTPTPADAHSENESLSSLQIREGLMLSLQILEGSMLKMANRYDYLTRQQERLERQLLLWKVVGLVALLALVAVVLSGCGSAVTPHERFLAEMQPKKGWENEMLAAGYEACGLIARKDTAGLQASDPWLVNAADAWLCA